jgi:hypothetical protein
MKVFLRAPYNYDVDVASDQSGLVCPKEDGVTQQQFRDECDINTIVARFGLTGELPGDYRAPVSGDFVGIHDFHSAMNAVRAADESFMEMPAALRVRFGHDPQRLIDFLSDVNNRAEAIKLGLIPAPVEVPREVVVPPA